MKKCAFSHAHQIYSLENYLTGGRCRFDISETSLHYYTSGNIFLPLATAQQTLLILCSVRVSVVFIVMPSK